ncbi:MAG: carbohydrate ABC transporter permease [Reinekea forsetii]|jgi:raffinose/stachyose/melibiose transport system permease protein|uniref:N-acetyl-D-glucosamine ABC transport system, permease protein 2 n=1 Tax=Reinekea forsetii TaxID=1336806 RepID=A0A2K8KSM2_9GAMM|nr:MULTISPECIES: carbohydrate ABC transporter permease [Reinekea]ATX77612.1 N-acetyl-D-glucosamine ABC transport system, permease protein 2 [Reinekea forsetii]MDO7641832.1 carbohydrate ABC transporter permease [Reinekea forsetii]MDO7644751.1 carbohydrate ABC transporter permease [Reinekea forsetii]MDO7673937.1 carbohydrate ABC transporter permease [Reinekea forsetii]
MIRLRNLARPALVHAVLLSYTVLALFPIFLVIINSFKSKRAIFNDPLALPTPATFSLVGYEKVLQESEVLTFFANSLIVTLVSLLLILTFGAMAAWGLSEYKFRGNRWLYFIMGFGIMVPIRLGTVSILSTMVSLNLTNTLTALILVYTAQGLPLAVFILAEFMNQIPKDLKEAARCDSVSEYKIFAQIIVPLIRPAIATVAVFSMIPIWNDLWFPLILAPGSSTQTITLGVQQFIGQYTTNWNAVLASLSLAVLPVVGLYFVFSRQLIRGITSGAVK